MADETLSRLAVKADGAAHLMNMSRSTVLKLAYSGELPSIKINKNRLFYVRDLESWLARNSRPERTEARLWPAPAENEEEPPGHRAAPQSMTTAPER